MGDPGSELNKLGIGPLTFWGSTPAYDITELIPKKQTESGEPVNILLIGQSDARHILKTMANLKNRDQELNIYVIENHPILQARQLLLLHLAFLPLDKLGLHEKTTEFMEIFGNIRIRPQTKNTIRTACETLIRLVTDDEAMSKEMSILNLQDLKSRDRDAIVDCLKTWMNSQLLAEGAENLWNIRLRQHLGSRYDARAGVFDWDYQMGVVAKNEDTKIIHISEFKSWRNCGQGFSEYESDYNQANPTFFYANRQPYHGDILIGPFIPYGIGSEDKSLLQKANDQFKKKSSDLTFHNLETIFSKVSRKTGDEELAKKFGNIKINFLSLDACEKLWKRSAFQEKFHAVYISSFLGQKLKPEMVKLLKLDATILVDRAKYIWYFRSENEKAYENKLLELADIAGLKLRPWDNDKNRATEFLNFEIRSKTETTEVDLNIFNEDDPSNEKYSDMKGAGDF